MLLWRDKPDGGREGVLLTVDVCTNPACTERHVIIHARLVEDTLISAKLLPGKLVTKSRPGPSPGTRPGFYGSVGLENGDLELRDPAPDPDAVAWFKAELDAELRAVLLARFEGARRRAREAQPAAPRSPTPCLPTAAEASPAAAVRTGRPSRPGRNDPCPCGSGRKYKRCCFVRAA